MKETKQEDQDKKMQARLVIGFFLSFVSFTYFYLNPAQYLLPALGIRGKYTEYKFNQLEFIHD